MKTIAFTTRLYKPIHEEVNRLIKAREISEKSLNQVIESALKLFLSETERSKQAKKTKWGASS